MANKRLIFENSIKMSKSDGEQRTRASSIHHSTKAAMSINENPISFQVRREQREKHGEQKKNKL